MYKIAITALCLAGYAPMAQAQEESTPKPHEKMFQHHVGVQMNELIRQVFNFNNSSSSTLNNPYLITYSINHIKTGFGLRIGAGYNKTILTNDDGINRKETNSDKLNLRIGVEKAFKLSEKWSAGAGLDAVYNIENSNTKTLVRSIDSSTSVIVSKNTGVGGGAMAWLRYAISPHVVIGTEASMYYIGGNQKQDITITQFNTGPFPIAETTTSSINNKTTDVTFSVPVVFYLMVRF